MSVSFRNASKPSIKRRRQASINQVEYKGIMNASCQTKDGIRGIQNVDFFKVGLSLSECMSKCSFAVSLIHQAGWEEQECTSRCLKPRNYDSCIGEAYNPVRCGTKKKGCEYENICLAIEAGFSADSCEYICDYERNLGCFVACTLEEYPVLCGKAQCRYANPCLGTKAAGFVLSQCTSAGNITSVTTEEKTGTSP